MHKGNLGFIFAYNFSRVKCNQTSDERVQLDDQFANYR